MRKIKYVTVVAIVAISGVIGFMSMKKNSPKTGLSGLALANVEALTQSEGMNSPEWYDFFNNYEIKERIFINTKNCKNGVLTYKGVSFSVSSCTRYTGAEIHNCYDGGNRSECTSSHVGFYF